MSPKEVATLVIERIASVFPGLVAVREVEGEPYLIAGREIRPVARVIAVRPGRCWILGVVQPVALVENVGEQVHRIPIAGGSASVMAMALLLAAPVVVWLIARSRRRRAS